MINLHGESNENPNLDRKISEFYRTMTRGGTKNHRIIKTPRKWTFQNEIWLLPKSHHPTPKTREVSGGVKKGFFFHIMTPAGDPALSITSIFDHGFTTLAPNPINIICFQICLLWLAGSILFISTEFLMLFRYFCYHLVNFLGKL